MPGRLAVDFGTSNTVLAVWDDVRQEGQTLTLRDFARSVNYLVSDEASERISVIPSLIHYATDGREWVGQQVVKQNLTQALGTFRWMKRYISNRTPRKEKVHGREISPDQAGQDFLANVLKAAVAELDLNDEEVAFTVPVEAFEHYENWLTTVAESAGISRFRLIDEPSAAALGCGISIQPGQVYFVFDFGGGTLDVAVVLVEESADALAGRRCRVLGKAGAELGGMTVDGWLFAEVLRRNQRRDNDGDVRRLSRELLRECERAKESLSSHDRAEISVMNPDTGALLGWEPTRHDFEEMLNQHDALTLIDQTIRRAINAARERGYNEEHISQVLMVGGSSLIPCVQQTVQRIFGRDRVQLRRPLDAVARGAAAFIAGVDFYDHIQHEYAVRYRDPTTGEYRFRSIVKRGTAYPAATSIERVVIKASYPGQTELGVAIFEMSEQRRGFSQQAVELVFDPTGAARLTSVLPSDLELRSKFWINEHSPTFLKLDSPAKQGQSCFEIEFFIDTNKRLLITARDLANGRLALQDYPVVKLT